MTGLATQYMTVVYRGVTPGDESIALGSHPLVVALSWTHAIDVRDAVIRERDKLRGFARAIMESWPLGDVDGIDLQEMAIEHGLIAPADPAPTEPCGESCACVEYYAADEWAKGAECYRRTALLTGEG